MTAAKHIPVGIPGANGSSFVTPQRIHATQIKNFEKWQWLLLISSGISDLAVCVKHQVPRQRMIPLNLISGPVVGKFGSGKANLRLNALHGAAGRGDDAVALVPCPPDGGRVAVDMRAEFV